jgi:hypothetical protein
MLRQALRLWDLLANPYNPAAKCSGTVGAGTGTQWHLDIKRLRNFYAKKRLAKTLKEVKKLSEIRQTGTLYLADVVPLLGSMLISLTKTVHSMR